MCSNPHHLFLAVLPKYWKLAIVLAISSLVIFLTPNITRAQSCVAGACVSSGTDIANVDTQQSELLNALLGGLLGTNLDVSMGNWQTIAQGSINLEELIDELQVDLNLGSRDAVLGANITLTQFINAAIDVASANGQTSLVAALNDLALDLPATGIIQLGDLLDLQLGTNNLGGVNLDALDLMTGVIQLYNFDNRTTAAEVTIPGADLGLANLGTISLRAIVLEAPTFICGETGSTFNSAAIRLAIELEGLGVDLNTGPLATTLEGILSTLGADVTLSAQLANLSLYVDVAKGSGTISTINTVSQIVTLSLDPSVASIYLGNIPDNEFFDRTRPLTNADVDFASIGTVDIQVTTPAIPPVIPAVTLLDVTTSINARSFSNGSNPSAVSVPVSAPFPKTVASSTSTAYVDNLLTGLLTNLEVQINITDAGGLGALLGNFVNGLVSGITDLLKGTNGVLEPILDAALGDLVDPLLNGLGIRLGTMYATVHGIAQSCPDITVTPTTVAFPNTLINTSAAAQAVTIRNGGTLALTLGTITLGGTGSSHFSLNETCGASLAPGASCSASITFTPTSVGAQSATLTINSGDPDEATVVVNISGTGTGTLPVITSDGGGAAASINVAENQTAVTTVMATGNPIPGFSIQGGADAARFSINGATGVLIFTTAPDFENPTDADGNNTYIVTVRAANAVGNDDQTITVTVTNVNEAPPAPTITQPLNGATTTDTTPTISGTAQPNNTVIVHEGSTQICTATANAGGNWSCEPSSPLSQGLHTVHATASNNNNDFSAPSNNRSFTIDSVAPTPPVITTPGQNSVTTDNTPTINGTAEAGSTVNVTENGAPICSAVTSGTGTWTCTPSTALSDGPHAIVATATDTANNISALSQIRNFTVDTTGPVEPTINTPTPGQTVTDNTPTISGTAEPNSTVAVTENGAPRCTAPVDSNGNWSCDSSPLSDGPHTVVATATDAHGNVGSPSAGRAFIVDSTRPVAPIITTPANNSSTSDNTPTISGTAEADSTVTVREGGNTLCITTATTTGTWNCTPGDPLSDGPHTVTATAADSGGAGPASAPTTFTVDTLAPAAPIITAPANNSTTSDNTPAISGTAEAGSTVNVTENGAPICSTVTSGTGTWTCTPSIALSDGPHTIRATATDAANNLSPLSAPVSFTVDTTPPAPPLVSAPAANGTTNDTTPAFVGTAEPNSTVNVTENGNPICSATTDNNGNWTCTPSSLMSQGAHTVNATATDGAGNTSQPTPHPFTIDTSAVSTPNIITPAPNARVNNDTPAISGTADPNVTVTVTEDGNAVCQTSSNGSGQWNCSPASPMSEGPHTITAVATNVANTASSPATRTFTIDTTPPAEAPTINNPAEGSSTSNPTPTISGTAEADSTVTVREGGNPLCTATTNGAGSWTCTSSTLSEGPHAITATATDAAGNVGPTSAPRNFTVDTSAPPAPAITTPATGSVVNESTPTIGGTAEPNSNVTVSEAGTPVCTATANGSGAWNCIPGTPLSDGEHTITANATDVAGNSGPASQPVDFTVDTAAPAVPVIFIPEEGSTTNNNTPTISGTAEPGSTVNVSETGNPVCVATADGAGNWSCVPGIALSDGPHTISAAATDAAGNVSPASTPVSFVVDTTPPAPPMVNAPPAGGTTNDDTPTFIGTSEPGSTVDVSENGNPICSATTDSGGVWTCTPATPMGQGPHTVDVIATDPAGNQSSPTEHPFIVDPSAVSTPSIINPAQNSSTASTTPTISGTADPDVTVAVAEGGNPVCVATADATGSWNCTPATPLSEGEHTINAVATNSIGTSSTPATRTFFVDTTAPAAPTVITPAAGSTTSDTTPVISGTAEPASTVTVRENNTILCTTATDAQGNWSCTPASELSNGPHLIEVTASDAAGNSSPTISHPFTIGESNNDDDGDGIPNDDECPNFPNCPDSDDDGTPDYLDPDDDGDGIPTANECPNHPNCPDSDDDGTPDYLDPDDDGDGIPTANECPNYPNCPDSDDDGTPDYLDPDDDGDGIPTANECPNFPNCPDSDDDGTPDYLDPDDDGDGVLTEHECPDFPNCPDTDDDGRPNYLDADDDGDSVLTKYEAPDLNGDGNPADAQDTDNDGTPDYLDPDDDGDLKPTITEQPDPNGDGNPSDAVDSDGDGIPDYLDPDDDNPGIVQRLMYLPLVAR